MVDKRNSPTYQAQKILNDPTAWRSLENKYFTSSSLAGLSLKQLDLRQVQNVAEEIFADTDQSSFFNNVKSAIVNVFDLINQDTIETDLNTINQEIFDYIPTVDLVAFAVRGGQFNVTADLFQRATEKVKELQNITKSINRSSGRNIREKVDIVNQQVDSINILNGNAGRKIASGVINSFLSVSESTAADNIDVLISTASDLYPTGSIGSELINQAEPVFSAALQLLQTATEALTANTETAKINVSTKLTPLYSILNDASRFVSQNISSELTNVINQFVGVASTIDRGLSAVKTDDGQLQPVSGQFPNESGVRVSTQQFKVPSEVAIERFASGNTGIFGYGINSTLPSVYAQSTTAHPRLLTSDKHRSISGPQQVVTPELINPRLEVIDIYRKYPGQALLNPEIANGPSLTSSVIEPVIDNIIGNRNTGTTVGDITSVLKTAEQIVIPRIG